MTETKDLVDHNGKPKRAAVSPVIPQRERANPHTVLDVHWTPPRGITCKCGWSTAGRTIDDVERLWKLHQKEMAA